MCFPLLIYELPACHLFPYRQADSSALPVGQGCNQGGGHGLEPQRAGQQAGPTLTPGPCVPRSSWGVKAVKTTPGNGKGVTIDGAMF